MRCSLDDDADEDVLYDMLLDDRLSVLGRAHMEMGYRVKTIGISYYGVTCSTKRSSEQLRLDTLMLILGLGLIGEQMTRRAIVYLSIHF